MVDKDNQEMVGIKATDYLIIEIVIIKDRV
jgi:hypothetical protein